MVGKRRAHVLWVNAASVPPSEAGGTRHFDMGRALAARGWRVTIAASDFHLHQRAFTRRSAGDRRTIRETVDDVEFRWIYASPYRGNDARRVLNWLSFAVNLTRERWDGDPPDVVIGSSPHLFAAWAAARLARRLRVPFVFEVRDLWPESLEAVAGRRGAGYWVLDRLASHLYRRASRIVVLARGAAGAIEARGIPSDRLVYLPNGVDPGSWPLIVRPVRPGLRLLYAGAHGPANGLNVVLDAAALLRDDAGIRFTLIGDGPAKPALMAQATRLGLDNVEFRASVAKGALRDVFAAADAGLMVLRDAPLFAWGVSPNKLFDYFAASLPVVCNVPGDVADMVRDAGAGEQASDPSATALATAIRRLSARPADERGRLGDAGRAWVLRHHDRVALAERLGTTLHEVIGQ